MVPVGIPAIFHLTDFLCSESDVVDRKDGSVGNIGFAHAADNQLGVALAEVKVAEVDLLESAVFLVAAVKSFV